MTAPATTELLCLTQRAPLLLKGTLTPSDDDRWVFTSAAEIELDVTDCNAIVNTNDERPMMTLHIVEQENERLVLYTIATHYREKRSYPRLFSRINLRLLPVTSDSGTSDWMSGVTPITAVDEAWMYPKPFMNFSVNGVAFDWHTSMVPNTRLLVALDGDGDTHRCIARVVRCTQRDSEQSESWEVALYFEQMADAAVEYLVRLTTRLQDSML